MVYLNNKYLVLTLLSLFCGQTALGQDNGSAYGSGFGSGGGFTRFPQRSLENILNQVDGNFGNMPATASQTGQLNNSSAFSYPQRAPQGSYNPGGVRSAGAYRSGQTLPGSQSGYMQSNQVRPGMGAVSPFAGGGAASNGGIMNAYAPLGGMHQPLQSGPPPFSKQNLLRIFFGGGSGSGFGGSSGGDSSQNQAKDASIVGQAEALLQRARNQAAQAESDAERARNGDRGSRLSAASSAQYHANDARSAADTAASITYGASQYAQDYAAQARDAANRAQAAADRANYNANI